MYNRSGFPHYCAMNWMSVASSSLANCKMRTSYFIAIVDRSQYTPVYTPYSMYILVTIVTISWSWVTQSLSITKLNDHSSFSEDRWIKLVREPHKVDLLLAISGPNTDHLKIIFCESCSCLSVCMFPPTQLPVSVIQYWVLNTLTCSPSTWCATHSAYLYSEILFNFVKKKG